MKKFTCEKDGCLHELYRIGSIGSPGGSRKSGPIGVGLFARRTTLSVLFVLYACILKLAGLCLTVVLLDVPVAVLTVLANCVTIPLGIGVSAMYPEQRFLYMPFTMSLPGGKRNLGWVVVPIWIFVINFWNMAYGDFRSLTTGFVFMWTIIAVLIYFRALSIAKMGEITVEFVDPPVETEVTKA